MRLSAALILALAVYDDPEAEIFVIYCGACNWAVPPLLSCTTHRSVTLFSSTPLTARVSIATSPIDSGESVISVSSPSGPPGSSNGSFVQPASSPAVHRNKAAARRCNLPGTFRLKFDIFMFSSYLPFLIFFFSRISLFFPVCFITRVCGDTGRRAETSLPVATGP